MTTWASRISDLRAKGMTLAEIGALIGLAPSSVSDIEQGRTATPRGDAAVKLYELHRSVISEVTRIKSA
jgi:Helix-turn-helix.